MSPQARANDTSPNRVADNAELAALQSDSSAYSLDDLRIVLRQAGPTQEIVEDEDEAMSLIVDDAQKELRRRADVLGASYPFRLNGMILTTEERWRETPAYVFLLLSTVLTWAGRRTGIRYFEEIVAQALGAYIGGEAVRFGWPRRAPVPSKTECALNYLAEKIGEKRATDITIFAHDKDMGLDVAAWKHFPDKLPGKLILFGQCATGPKWREKIGDPNLPLWRDYIAYRVRPVPVFAVPWTIDNEMREAMQGRASVIFDRLRIAGSLADWGATKEIQRWCRRNAALA